MKKVPDFLIIGAMKAGTTRLYEMLCDHPRVVPASAKEIHYFTMHKDKPLLWYLDHFPDSVTHLTGEASPTYMSEASLELVRRIRETLPRTRIIMIVRDPVARAVSQFHHHRSINTAPELQDLSVNEFFSRPRPAPNDPVKNKVDWYLRQCLKTSHYTNAYRLYSGVFGRHKTFVLHNEDLLEQPAHTLNRVFRFLGLTEVGSDISHEVRYSNGSSPDELCDEVRQRLEEELYPDYLRFKDETATATEDAEAVVKEGREDWLFLTGGSNHVQQLFTEAGTSALNLDGWVEIITARQERARQNRYVHLHVLAPDKLAIYPEYFDGDLNAGPGRALMQKLTEAGATQAIIDLWEPLRRAKTEGLIYWKTDSHWTTLGHWAACKEICLRLGIAAGDPLIEGPVQLALRDLGAKVRPLQPELTQGLRFTAASTRTWRNELVAFKEQAKRDNDMGLHVGSAVEFSNPEAVDRRRVLLFGDSFAEYREGHLTHMLSKYFSTVRFVWSVSIDYRVVEVFSPDILLTENTERFLTYVPDDQFELDAVVTEKLRAQSAEVRGE